MRRRTILIVAACLAILAGLLPMVAVAHLLRVRAIAAEQRHMAEYARWTLMRTKRVFADARRVLIEAETRPGTECSPDHVAQLRQIAMDARNVEDIGYFRDGRLVCTSLGPIRQHVPRTPPDVDLGGGFALVLHIEPRTFRSQPMLAMSHDGYTALIKPERLVDVLTDSHMTLGIAAGPGRLIAMSGKGDPRLLRILTAGAAAGIDERHVFASLREPPLTAFAFSDRAQALGRLRNDYLLLLPMGLLVSTVLVGIVIWVSRQRLSPEKELAIAIRRREFVVHYQPIIDLSNGRCVAAEALLRWRRPDGRWIRPDLFIPLAEDTGLISPLTDLLIERVIEDQAELLRADRGLHISINISARDLESGRFLPVLSDAVARSGIEPSQIWIEATEQGFIRAEIAASAIKAARAAGHMVAIDDFGTGYSSLSLLQGLPLDALKIDKSFVEAIATDAATSVVTPHIIDMAHGLKLRIIAEGVETREQEAYLRAAGVPLAQGWLYSRALPAAEFAAFRQGRNAEGDDSSTDAGRGHAGSGDGAITAR
ncbi:EAL domain-containing protein [Rhizorhabdus histidinilytica]|uniref:cyclic-guanylate-specific phosphodiesterase n=1 Tax=Rhizorhabdus histidinilytica TaxID=439228 RepID=A0A1T5E9G6_9SPHN|nr:EAL domain-containing protein [Rhizorhabdus histidinilytica]SKB80722.1 sensor c-di-GMP phosphodiesterase, contains CSS-motif sensor and EAL domain [Rhizorhabdus histidinilytica]